MGVLCWSKIGWSPVDSGGGLVGGACQTADCHCGFCVGLAIQSLPVLHVGGACWAAIAAFLFCGFWVPRAYPCSVQVEPAGEHLRPFRRVSLSLQSLSVVK